MKTFCSWYGTEGENLNEHVSMMASETCPDCKGNDPLITVNDALKYHVKCTRCHGDGLLTNPIKFCAEAMTCAMPYWFRNENGFRLGQYFKITNIENNKSVLVMLNDVGPKEELKRAVDLTRKAFEEIADLKKGVISVDIQPF